MCGGYLSFAGYEAKAKYYRSPIEDVLPVNIYTFDDRVETPEGISVIIKQPGHPILHGVDGTWPDLLGYQETKLKPTADSIVETDTGDPLIAACDFGKGRAMVWTTDVGPALVPPRNSPNGKATASCGATRRIGLPENNRAAGNPIYLR